MSANRILITFPCKVGELLDRLNSVVSDGIDKDEICTAGYDLDGDCIFVTQDYPNNQNKETWYELGRYDIRQVQDRAHGRNTLEG